MLNSSNHAGPWRRHSLWFGPVLAIVIAIAMYLSGWSQSAWLTGGLACLCAVWWVFEPVPIPATSLIPLGVFPLLGILDGKQVAQSYGSPLILLLMGGAMLSKAMEKSGAHSRIALGMVRAFSGGQGNGSMRRLVFGFMAAAAFLSMWISNTATTLMLLPVAIAVLDRVEDKRLVMPLILGIAYAASIGGMGTPIGTPPNVVFLKIYSDSTGIEPSFLEWMGWALPVVALLLPAVAWWLTRAVKAQPLRVDMELPGAWRSEERRVLIVFALTALAWMTLREPFGGWSQWLGLESANYAAVALTAVLVLFVLPNGRGGRLLDWESASSIQWGVLLLFAGGIALAKAFVSTGISASLGDMLGGLIAIPTLLLLLCICLAVTFLTEMTSNTATTTLLMPILAATALSAGIEPALLMLPAALTASCAFMLPVATAPNAIAFSTGQVTVNQMARQGVALNLIGAVIVVGVCYWQLA